MVCSHCILIPQGSTGSSTFLASNESPYFSHYNLKISASNSLYFGSYNRKCTYFQYTNLDFLMYVHNSLIPSVSFLLLPQERKWEATLRWNCTKCVLGVKVDQLRVRIYMSKWAQPSSTTIWLIILIKFVCYWPYFGLVYEIMVMHKIYLYGLLLQLLLVLKGNCTSNQNWACFVCYLITLIIQVSRSILYDKLKNGIKPHLPKGWLPPPNGLSPIASKC